MKVGDKLYQYLGGAIDVSTIVGIGETYITHVYEDGTRERTRECFIDQPNDGFYTSIEKYIECETQRLKNEDRRIQELTDFNNQDKQRLAEFITSLETK